MQHDHDCILCYQPCEVIGLLPCNHRPICYSCVMKMFDSGFYSCPICKAASKSMLFTDNLKEDYEVQVRNKNILKGEAGSNHLFSNRTVKQHVEKESMFICTFPKCNTQYQTLNTLKKHLNECHKLQFCELCLDNRRCLLSEQTLYSEPELNSHLADGEIEETGVVSLYHPYCEFCRGRYYDEDTFLKHLKTHEQCFICSKQQQKKYVYYKEYKTLELHFDASHYMCKHNNCLDKKFTNVFATADLRDFHYAEAHMGQNFSKKAKRNIECLELTGFYQAEAEEIEEKPSDGLGKNFEKELISISRRMELVNQTHEDGLLDVREFYSEKCAFTKHMATSDIVNRYGQVAYMMNEGHHLTIESVDFFKPMAMKSLPRPILNSFIDDLCPYQQGNQLKRLFFDGMADIKSFEHYCIQLCQVIEFDNPMLFYYIFPQLIRFFKDTNERKKFMDTFYLKRLLHLPIERECLLHSCKSYLDFVIKFRTAIEQNIGDRLLNGKLNLGLYVKQLRGEGDPRDQQVFHISKQKMKNLYHMVEKIKTIDLLKLNWLLKIGLPLETHNYITKTIYFSPKEDCAHLLDRLYNSELAAVYTYYHIIEDALTNKERFKFEKSKEDINILRDLLAKNKQKFAKVAGVNDVTNFQDAKKHTQYKKMTVPSKEQIVYKISEADLPHLPTPTKQQEDQGSKTSKVQVGFINNGCVPNLKKWDEGKRAEQSRQQAQEENAARQKVLQLRAAKKQEKAAKKRPQQQQKIQEQPSPPSIKMTKVVIKDSPKPVQVKKPTPDMDELQQAIEESKKSFELEQKRRQQQQDERKNKLRVQIDRQRKEAGIKHEKPVNQEPALKVNTKDTKEDEKKKQLKNVFEVLEYEQEEIKMKKDALSKPESPVKQPQKITMKTMDKGNTKMPTPFPGEDDSDNYPTLSRPPEPYVKVNDKQKQPKNKPPVEIDRDKPIITPDEFPTLGKQTEQASWIHQVAGRPKSPQPEEVKVRKKKGRTVTEKTIDIFGRN